MIIVYLIIGYLISICITAIALVTSANITGLKIKDSDDFTYILSILCPGVNTVFSIIIILVLVFYLTFELIKFILLCIFYGIKFLILKILNKNTKNK
mgnify:CR=1 FL=1